MSSYLAFWQTESVAKVQSTIHVRVGEGNKVLVFAGENTIRIEIWVQSIYITLNPFIAWL